MFDLERIEADAPLAGVEYHPEIASTNDRAMELARNSELLTPHLVLADKQTAGRGRGSNRWWSQNGALTFTVIYDLALPTARWPQISLSVGLAVCEVLSARLPREQIGLKWPNDVHLAGKKVCGILVEIPSQRPGRFVIGIGLNVNNSPATAQAELTTIATSMFDVSGQEFDRSEVLIAVIRALDRELRQLQNDSSDLQSRWQALCVLQGEQVQLTAGEKVVSGRCEGIDADGALVLMTERGRETFFGGIVRRVT